MNILKSIGASFTKLWRWIRETAWVQPLLIVGAIFAVIFSIPKATSWVQSFGVGTSTAYYMAQKKTLEGENHKDSEITTEADKLTYALMKWSNFADQHEYATYDEFKTNFEASEEKSIIDRAGGEKFYLVYVAKGNDACDSVQEGFENLQNNWGVDSRYAPSDSRSFAFSTIYTDEDSTNDDDFVIESEKSAFNRYLLKFDDLGFFADAGARFDTCPYKKNANLTSSSNYDNFIDAGTKLDSSSFIKPTVILVDFSKEAFDLGRVGVSEILFGVSGNTAYEKAELLLQMWNHADSDSSNPFTKGYNA